LSNLNSD